MATPQIKPSASQVNGGANAAADAQTKLLRMALRRATIDQAPEKEGGPFAFVPLAVASTPSSLRTDRKIKWISALLTGRITVGAGNVTFRTPPIVPSPLFNLFQLFTLRGTHLTEGAISPFIVKGETQTELNMLFFSAAAAGGGYQPVWWNSVNGGALTKYGALSGTANATNDFKVVLEVPLFPMGSEAKDIVLNCIHGPDWPGNLYVDLLCGDETSLGVAAGSVAFHAFGSGAGSPQLQLHTERPLLTVDLMNRIVSAIPFRLTQTQQPTQGVVNGGTDVDLTDLFVGDRDTTRIILKAGTKQSAPALSAGMDAYASLSDAIVNPTYFSLDGRALRFQTDDAVLVGYMQRTYLTSAGVGYRIIDFVDTPGEGGSVVSAAFPSAQLTAARKFQLVGHVVTATANGNAEVIQEMLKGRGRLIAA